MNHHKGESEIEFGQEARILRMTIGTVMDIEREFGKPVGEVFEDATKGSFRAVFETLYFGLKQADKRISRGQVERWFNPEELGMYAEKIGESIQGYFGKLGQEVEENGPLDDKA